jgi:sarcosine oxidase gamma subunit
VLSRLVPIDLRPNVFEVGHAARTMLGHMSCLLHAGGGDGYVVLGVPLDGGERRP